jgi:ABC-2 type transport system ATP-binding protein
MATRILTHLSFSVRLDFMLKVDSITKDFLLPISFRRIARLDFKRLPAVHALKDVSFDLPKGSVLAILGPNGAGKTTILKTLATLIIPDSGTVRLNDLILGKDDDRIKAAIGLMTSAERSFYWRLTGRQNLEFFAAMQGLSPDRIKTRIAELYDLFGINYGDRRFDSYSTGMQQKLGLMRAVLHDPELLLLDEPTKSLDYAGAVALRDFIKDMMVKKHGKTVIFTTHQMEEAAGFADLFLILHNGRAHAYGSLGQLRAQAGLPDGGLGEIFMKLTGGQTHA